jgi:hypothetical protein
MEGANLKLSFIHIAGKHVEFAGALNAQRSTLSARPRFWLVMSRGAISGSGHYRILHIESGLYFAQGPSLRSPFECMQISAAILDLLTQLNVQLRRVKKSIG